MRQPDYFPGEAVSLVAVCGDLAGTATVDFTYALKGWYCRPAAGADGKPSSRICYLT